MSAEDERYYHRIQDLVNGLVAKTTSAGKNAGTVVWDQVSKDAYELSITRNSIVIKSRDGDGQYPYVLNIVDDEGRLIESVEDGGGTSSLVKLGDLYRVAARSHKGVEETLTELMSELGIAETPLRRPEEPPF